jgi:hypothetical protein
LFAAAITIRRIVNIADVPFGSRATARVRAQLGQGGPMFGSTDGERSGGAVPGKVT